MPLDYKKLIPIGLTVECNIKDIIGLHKGAVFFVKLEAILVVEPGRSIFVFLAELLARLLEN